MTRRGDDGEDAEDDGDEDGTRTTDDGEDDGTDEEPGIR